MQSKNCPSDSALSSSHGKTAEAEAVPTLPHRWRGRPLCRPEVKKLCISWKQHRLEKGEGRRKGCFGKLREWENSNPGQHLKARVFSKFWSHLSDKSCKRFFRIKINAPAHEIRPASFNSNVMNLLDSIFVGENQYSSPR